MGEGRPSSASACTVLPCQQAVYRCIDDPPVAEVSLTQGTLIGQTASCHDFSGIPVVWIVL